MKKTIFIGLLFLVLSCTDKSSEGSKQPKVNQDKAVMIDKKKDASVSTSTSKPNVSDSLSDIEPIDPKDYKKLKPREIPNKDPVKDLVDKKKEEKEKEDKESDDSNSE